MKLSFFRKPVRYVPSKHESGLQDYRERIISILLVSATTLGALAYITAFILAFRSHQYGFIAIFSACYLWVLIVTLQGRRLSYTVKIYSLLFIIYLLGVINLLQYGLSSDAEIFLLAFTIMTSLMIGARSGIFALVISIATYALAGVLISQGDYVPLLSINNRKPIDWISGGLVLTLLGTILALSLNTILHGLNDSIAKVKIMVVDTDRDRSQLRQHSQDLQRRLAQLRVIAEIEHSISAVLDPNELLRKVVDSLSEHFGLYFVGVFLYDERELSRLSIVQEGEGNRISENAISKRSDAEVILQTGTTNTIPEGYRVLISGAPGFGWSIQNRKPHAVDVGGRKDEFIINYLPMAHTELTLPLLGRGQVMGVLAIYSTQSNAFDNDDISLFQSLGDSLATALENARLFQQTQNDLEEIRILQRQYLSQTWAEAKQIHGVLEYTYEASAQGSDNQETTDQAMSTYSTPISLRDQQIGQITLEAEKTAWSYEDRNFIESVITEAALALDNARLLDETLRRSKHDRLVADITRTVRSSTDIETILSIAIRELGRNLGASETAITLASTPESNGHGEQGGVAE
jgi:GAF domain-containing protein